MSICLPGWQLAAGKMAWAGQPCGLRAVGGTPPLAGPELTRLSWPLQVDTQTEDNDMNKRRRKGFNNLDEVRARGVSVSKGSCLPASGHTLARPLPLPRATRFQAWLDGQTVGLWASVRCFLAGTWRNAASGAGRLSAV